MKSAMETRDLTNAVAFATHTGFEHAFDYALSYIYILSTERIMVHATDLRVPGDTYYYEKERAKNKTLC